MIAAFFFVVVLFLPKGHAQANTSAGVWKASYYNNQQLSGPVVNTKEIPIGKNGSLNEDNGRNAPMAKVNSDHFSAKYVSQQHLTAGDYILRMRADDGARIYIDGKLVLNRWTDGAYHENAIKVHLSNTSAGDLHTIEVQYYDETSVSHIYMSIEPFSIPNDGWVGELYKTRNLQGTPFIIGGDNALNPIKNLDLDWGYGVPDELMPKDHFSATFQKVMNVTTPGSYQITVTANDGVRVYVDGKVLIDSWKNSNNEMRQALTNLSAGNHTIKVDYYEYSQAADIHFSIAPVGVGDWLATYYNNQSLSGNPVNSKVIKQGPNGSLNEDNGHGSPMANVNINHFSANYISQKHLAAGDYILRLRADDGARVYIDGKLVLDRWTDGGYHENAVKVHLANTSSGDLHTIQVKYFDKTSVSHIYTSIEPYSIPNDGWIGELYSKPDFQGNSVIIGGDNALQPIKNLDLDWGYGRPDELIPTDHFSAVFQKVVNVPSAGKYDINVTANDGVRVLIDGNKVIDSWKNSNNETRHALTNLSAGNHTVKVEYFEYSQAADIHFSMDTVPVDNWLATYFNNQNLSGQPVASQVLTHGTNGSLHLNNGHGSPLPAVNNDHFSGDFISQKHLAAGDYIIRMRADDGGRVYVDGKLVLDRWTDGGYHENAVKVHLSNTSAGDLHTIEVKYYDQTSLSQVYTSIEPFSIPTDGWIGEFYGNQNLQGSPIILGGDNALKPITNLSFDWGRGAPDELLPNDHFSARFTKQINVAATGTYKFTVKADDGIRVYVDGKSILDDWKNGGMSGNTNVVLNPGNHTLKVEYYDYTSLAHVSVSYAETTPQVNLYNTTKYDYSLEQAIQDQLNLRNYAADSGPKTDQHPTSINGYISDAALKISGNIGTVQNGPWNFRDKPNTTTSTVIDELRSGETVTILSSQTVNGQKWYYVNYYMDDWEMANTYIEDQLSYYLNPTNFKKGSADYYQFLELNSSANLNATEVNDKILKGKGILNGKASSFIKAGQTYHINEIYLIAHALLETGNGSSELATGVCYDPNVKGQIVENCSSGKKVYNMYGIGAFDATALHDGAEFAYNHEWFTPEAAIIGGAQFIDTNYVEAGQNTLYKMRWNPDNPGSHQYATDVGWADKQTSEINSLYGLISSYTNVYDIPQYN